MFSYLMDINQKILFLAVILCAFCFNSHSDWKFGEIGGAAFSTGFEFDSVLYVQTYGDQEMPPRMYRSFNDGETWEPTELSFLNSSIVGNVYFNANGDYYLFVTNDGLYRVNKNGTEVVHSGNYSCIDNDGNPFSEEWDSPDYLQFVELGTKWVIASKLGIVQSTDSGKTWSLPMPCLLSEDEWSCENSEYYFTNTLTRIGTTLIAGISNGVLNSSDSGRTWESDSFFSGDAFFLKTVSDRDVFVITGKLGIYSSSDSGKTWLSANSGYPQLSSGFYEKVKDAIVFKDQIYIGIRSGVFSYQNQKWEKTGENLPVCVFPVRFFSSQKSLFCITNDGLYVLRNDGWQLSGSDFQGAKLGINTIISHEGNIWAGGKGGIYMSSDTGDTWKNMTAGVDDEPTVMDLLSCKYGLFAAVADNGLYMWDDLNQLWKPVRFGNNKEFQFSGLYEMKQFLNGLLGVQPYKNGTLYFDLEKSTVDSVNNYHSYAVSAFGDTVLQSNYNVIMGSTNGGQVWNSLTAINYAADFLKTDNLILISAAYGSKIYLSNNNGVSWSTKSLQSNFSHGDNLEYSQGNYYALTNKYIYYSKDTCKTWDSISYLLEMQNGFLRPLYIDGGVIAIGGDKGLWVNRLTELIGNTNVISPNQISSGKHHFGNKSGCLEIDIAKKSALSIEVYDLQGRIKMKLVKTVFKSGIQQFNISSMLACGTNIVKVKIDGSNIMNFKSIQTK